MKKLNIIVLTTIILLSNVWCIKNHDIQEDNEINIQTNKEYYSNLDTNNIENMNSFKTLNPNDFEKLANSWEYIIIDIRSPIELIQTWIIENAINIEYYSENFNQLINELDKDKKYLIYCNSWNRTNDTLNRMKSLWFNDVNHLWWWIISWYNSWKRIVSCDLNWIC